MNLTQTQKEANIENINDYCFLFSKLEEIIQKAKWEKIKDESIKMLSKYAHIFAEKIITQPEKLYNPDNYINIPSDSEIGKICKLIMKIHDRLIRTTDKELTKKIEMLLYNSTNIFLDIIIKYHDKEPINENEINEEIKKIENELVNLATPK